MSFVIERNQTKQQSVCAITPQLQTHPIKANGALLKYLIIFWHQTRVNSPGLASLPAPQLAFLYFVIKTEFQTTLRPIKYLNTPKVHFTNHLQVLLTGKEWSDLNKQLHPPHQSFEMSPGILLARSRPLILFNSKVQRGNVQTNIFGHENSLYFSCDKEIITWIVGLDRAKKKLRDDSAPE